MKNDNKEFEYQPLQTIYSNNTDEDCEIDYDFGYNQNSFNDFFEKRNKTKNKTEDKTSITRTTTQTKTKRLKRNKSRNNISFNQSNKESIYEEKFDEENSNGINKLNPSINVDDLDNFIEKMNLKYLDNKEDELQNKLHPNPNQDIISHSREPIIPIFKPYLRENDDPNFEQAGYFQFHDVIKALKPKPTDMDIKVFNALCEMCQSCKNDYELAIDAYEINKNLFPDNTDVIQYYKGDDNDKQIINTYLFFLDTQKKILKDINRSYNRNKTIRNYRKTNQYLQKLSEQLNEIYTELTKFDAEQIAKDFMSDNVSNYFKSEITTKINNYINTQNKNIKIDEKDEIDYEKYKDNEYEQLIKKYSQIKK